MTTAVDVRICYDCDKRPALTVGLCHNCYERMRKRAIVAGTWESALIPMDAAFTHVQTLRDHGYSLGLIAHLAGVQERTVGRIARSENDQIEIDTEESILAVPVISLWNLWKTTEYSHRMPSGPAVRRLRALATDGWMYPILGEMLGWETTQVARLALRPSKYVFSSTTRAVDAIYSDPDLAVPARRARRDILIKGWPSAMEWDNIDDKDETRHAHKRAASRVAKLFGEA